MAILADGVCMSVHMCVQINRQNNQYSVQLPFRDRPHHFLVCVALVAFPFASSSLAGHVPQTWPIRSFFSSHK